MVTKQRKLRVAVGMSGGVDSSVSAALLVEQGFDVAGVHLVCYEEPGCRAPEDRKDALEVAIQLGIPFEVLDFQKEYKKKVIDYFYSEYEAGRTPNPDVMCNKEIKFGLFYEWAIRSGFDFVATGHYAQIRNQESGIRNKYSLLRGKDKKKDQSYFLYLLRLEQLGHIMFPIGEMTKSQVRNKARKMKLPVADKPDSQGICFLGDIDMQEFLRRRIKEKWGEVVIKINPKSETRNPKQLQNSNDQNSKLFRASKFEIRNSDNYEVIGSHKGVWFYTIGQRHGFTISASSVKRLGFSESIPPLYVVGKDVVHNRLIVGVDKESKRSVFEVSDVHWISNKNSEFRIQNSGVKVRIRHGGELIPAKIKSYNKFNKSINRLIVQSKSENEGVGRLVEVKLSKPQRGVAPGQSAVFYKGEECLGGGVIDIR